jgi:hypothetical protein
MRSVQGASARISVATTPDSTRGFALRSSGARYGLRSNAHAASGGLTTRARSTTFGATGSSVSNGMGRGCSSPPRRAARLANLHRLVPLVVVVAGQRPVAHRAAGVVQFVEPQLARHSRRRSLEGRVRHIQPARVRRGDHPAVALHLRNQPPAPPAAHEVVLESADAQVMHQHGDGVQPLVRVLRHIVQVVEPVPVEAADGTVPNQPSVEPQGVAGIRAEGDRDLAEAAAELELLAHAPVEVARGSLAWRPYPTRSPIHRRGIRGIRGPLSRSYGGIPADCSRCLYPPTLTVSSGLSVPSSRSRTPRYATRKLNRFGAPRYSHTYGLAVSNANSR